MKRDKEHWTCKDCGKDCFKNKKDFYMVTFNLWKKFGVGKDMLCMNCMEERIGHKLTKNDILRCPVTEWMNPYTKKILES